MMNVAVDNSGGSYALAAAVLIYTDSQRSHAFATKHYVDLDAGTPRIKPGSPLSVQDYSALIKALAPREQPGMRWNDQRLLASGFGRMMWWEPPRKRAMFFETSAHNAATFTAMGTCPTPGLVFIANFEPRALYVFAVKGNAAPEMNTPLYQAPFFNVWSRGQVCVGNADYPGEDQVNDLDAWMRMFFGSRFTHPNFTEPDRLTKGTDPVKFWKKHLASKAARFPERVFVDLPLTVGDLLGADAQAKLRAIPQARGEF